ncbi:hypothetical protein BN1708_004887, partial [Verticillium longisporum]
MADKAATKLPIRMQDSKPRKGEALRKEQHRYLRWERRHSRNGGLGWAQNIWPDMPEKAGDTIPSLPSIRELISGLIVRGALPLPLAFHVTEFANGMCSRVFKLEFPEGAEMPDGMKSTILLRFAAPLDPYWKTESEVATMAWLAAKTFVPVPRVYFFDSSANNDLGLEWVIMELIEGYTFANWIDDWADEDGIDQLTLTDDQMRLIGYQSNSYLLSLRARQFDKIGSLYCNWGTGEFYIGPMVHLDYFHGDRLQYEGLQRGPFSNISEYFKSLTDLTILEAHHMQEADRKQLLALTGAACWDVVGEGDPGFSKPPSVEGLQNRAHQINTELMPRLLAHVSNLPTFAGGVNNEAGPVDGWHTELMHPDLHSNNVLVTRSANGIPKIAAIIDWDWTCLMPPSLSAFMPPLELEFQDKLAGSVRYPNAQLLEMHHILAPGDLEKDILPKLQGYPVNNIASTIFRPAKKYIVKRALALRAVHHVVRRIAAWDSRDMEWVTSAIEFLNQQQQQQKQKQGED